MKIYVTFFLFSGCSRLDCPLNNFLKGWRLTKKISLKAHLEQVNNIIQKFGKKIKK